MADQEAYPFNILAIRSFHDLEIHPDVTFLAGENGSGKSTLIEGLALALALGFGAEGGTMNVRFETAETVRRCTVTWGWRKASERPGIITSFVPRASTTWSRIWTGWATWAATEAFRSTTDRTESRS